MSVTQKGVAMVAATVLLGLASGCGYTTKSSLDAKYQTIFVSGFHNQSREYDLAGPLTDAVIRKFINDTRLKVVARDNADLVMEGMVLSYQIKGMTYDKKDNVTQYVCVVVGAARVTDSKTGAVVWEDKFMAGETTFYTAASGQSSDRLRGNGEVFVPAVRSFATEEENRAAAEAIEQLASDIFYRTVEHW